MIDISTLPNVDPATGNLINGEMHDVTTPGDGTGTPVRKDWMQDLYYALVAVMNDAGVVADNSEEGATSSQFLTALKTVINAQLIQRVGQQLFTREDITLSASDPWWNIANPDQTLAAANFPDYVPYLRARMAKLKWASAILTGTVTVVAGATTAAVTGSGTEFNTALSVGDLVFVAGQFRYVTAIASATSMTLDEPITAAGGSSMWKITPKEGTQQVSDFPLTHYSISSNVVSLYANSTTAYPEVYTIMSALAEDLALHPGGSYTSWARTLTLPAALGTGASEVPAGTYLITAVTPANVGTSSAILTFAYAASNIGSTSLTGKVVNFYPHRTTSTTTAIHRRMADMALMNDGLYNVAGYRSKDQMQGHWHDLYGASETAAGGSISFWGIRGPSLQGENTAIGPTNAVRGSVTDGTNPTPNIGPITRPRSSNVNIYEYVGTYAP